MKGLNPEDKNICLFVNFFLQFSEYITVFCTVYAYESYSNRRYCVMSGIMLIFNEDDPEVLTRFPIFLKHNVSNLNLILLISKKWFNIFFK